MLTKRFLLISGLATAFFISGFLLKTNNDVLTNIVEKFISHQSKRPIEKVYLHFDKPYYAVGEDIWFKAYLVDGLNLSLDSSVSKVIYVELLDQDKKLIERHMLPAPEGIAWGDFHLSETLPQGNYLVRAYSNYMKNYEQDYFFQREIPVFDLSREVEMPAAKLEQKPDVQFFPEGGNLIQGVENRVAFKAINSSGESISIEGDVIDEGGAVVASFVTEHKGMGSFKFTPQSSKSYSAKLKGGLAGQIYPLPKSTLGYSVLVVDAGSTVKVQISANAASANPFHLVGQSRGEIFFAASGEVKGSPIVASIPKSKFPAGVAHLTVFDGQGVPHCERLVFINHDKKARVSITPAKTDYAKREEITVNIQALNDKGTGVQGNFSIAVYDEEAVKDLKPNQATIIDYLLLSSDLTGKIEEPAYYFKDKSSEKQRHLDLVMMTHDWRRFSWKEVMSGKEAPLEHFAEQGIRLSGRVVRSVGQKGAGKAKLKIFTAKGELIMADSDEEGRFFTELLSHYDSTRLAIQTENEKGKQLALKLEIDPFNPSPVVTYTTTPFVDFRVDDFIKQVEYRNQQRLLLDQQDAKMLEGVEITASRITTESFRKPAIYGKPSATVTSKDIPPSAINILQALQARIPGVIIRGVPPNMTINLRAGNDGPPLFTLDGTPVDLETINSLNPSDIEYVDVLRGNAAAIFGSRGINGVLAVYTKTGENSTRENAGMQRVIYPGYYRAREFYVPKYAEQPATTALDMRTTIYWNPSVETDDKGEAQLTFPANDVDSKYRIVVEGVTYEGQPANAVGTFVIK